MSLQRGLNIPKKALSLIMIGVLVLLFMLVVIIISQVSLGREAQEIAKSKQELVLFNKIHPIQAELEKASRDMSDVAPLDAGKSKYPVAKLAELGEFFGQKIRKAGLEPTLVSPSPESLSKGSQDLSVTLTMTGNILNLRNFLQDIGSGKELITVETVQAQKVYEAQEFRLKLWIAVE